jgi:hypothetical protein
MHNRVILQVPCGVAAGIISTMKLIAAVLFVIATAPSAWGQQLVLPEDAARDDAALARSFMEFARGAENTELAADAGAKFLLQLAAGSYQEAVATATAGRHQLPSGAGPNPSIRLELYARAKAAEAGGSVNPERAFRKAFSELVSSMDDKTALAVEHFLKAPVWAFQRRFDQALARHQNPRELTPHEALELMDFYFNLKSLQTFVP